MANGDSVTHTQTGAEESTLRRWAKEFKDKMQSWAGELESKAMIGLVNAFNSLAYLPTLFTAWNMHYV